MKLHDLQPAEGSRKPRERVGRGIAAGGGKTAGRGTKGQKARAGGSIPPWFEGGQTPLHMRIPKLRGFKNRFKIEYEVVNVGAIGALAERGAFEIVPPAGKSAKAAPMTAKAAPMTVNQDILRAVGLVRTLDKPLKILGAGELSMPLFVVADAFTASARAKIEAAGGSVNVLEIPSSPLAARGVTPEADDSTASADDAPAKAPARKPAMAASKPAKPSVAKASVVDGGPAADDAPAAEAATEDAPATETDATAASDRTAADDEPSAADVTETPSGDDA